MGDYRFNLVIPDDMKADIDVAAPKRGMTITMFIRNAIKVYNALIKEENAGKKLYIGDDRKIEKEIIIP